MEKKAEYEVYCNDDWVGGSSGCEDRALREAIHLAEQYVSEGEVSVYKVEREHIITYKSAKK